MDFEFAKFHAFQTINNEISERMTTAGIRHSFGPPPRLGRFRIVFGSFSDCFRSFLEHFGSFFTLFFLFFRRCRCRDVVFVVAVVVGNAVVVAVVVVLVIVVVVVAMPCR